MMELYSVVLETYATPPLEKLAALFQAICGWPRVDAITRANRARGIIAERLPAPLANQLQTALGNLGFASQMVRQQSVPASARGRRVQLLLPEKERLGVRWTLTGKPRWYDWQEVAVVSAAVVFHEEKEQVIRTEPMSDWPDRHALAAHTEITTRDVSRDMAMATVTLGKSPATLEHLRFRAPEVEYTTILGDDLRATPLENFCLLLARLGTHAANALITDETIELISASTTSPRLPRSPRFESEDEFDDYQRWLVVRHWLVNGQAT
jgi:hypothetical protein